MFGGGKLNVITQKKKNAQFLKDNLSFKLIDYSILLCQ